MDKHWNDITGSDGKTLFDPCPEGWRLPTMEDLKNLTLNERGGCRFVYEKIFYGSVLDGNWFPYTESGYWSTGDIVHYYDKWGYFRTGFCPTVWSFNDSLIREGNNRYDLNHVRCIKM